MPQLPANTWVTVVQLATETTPAAAAVATVVVTETVIGTATVATVIVIGIATTTLPLVEAETLTTKTETVVEIVGTATGIITVVILAVTLETGVNEGAHHLRRGVGGIPRSIGGGEVIRGVRRGGVVPLGVVE